MKPAPEILWLSHGFRADCKHFSRAKGGKPVDKNIRGLAWVAVKWALAVRPRVIMLENVPEIQTWCPLGEDGKPIKERTGETFEGFILSLSTGIPKDHPAFIEVCNALKIESNSSEAQILTKGLGYNVEYRILKSCDYGAPTARTRFYMIARCDGHPIVWAEPTHAPKNSEDVKAGRKKPYRTVAECIDWSIPAKSIFERDKPLAENTMRRIARGIQKFVIENPEPFIVPIECEEQRGTNDVTESLRAATTNEKYSYIAPTLIQYHSETSDDEVRGQEVDEPIMTIDTAPRYALSVAHIMKNYAGGYTGAGSAADAPLDTVTAIDHNSLVTAHIMTLRNNMDGQPIDKPLTTISCSGAHYAEVQAFLVKYYSTGAAKSVDEPLDTVTTMDRFALVTIHGEEYIIADIKMRMLQPRELFQAQGFSKDYIIDYDAEGRPYSKSKQVARCGNAVTPPVAEALVRANLREHCCFTIEKEKNSKKNYWNRYNMKEALVIKRQPNTEYILSLSYGKDSLACIEAVKQLDYPLDRIVHAEIWATDDIPADLPPMVEFKKKADKIIKERYGIEVEHICAFTKNGNENPMSISKLTYEKMFYHIPLSKNESRRGKIKGFPTIQGSWCIKLKEKCFLERVLGQGRKTNIIRYLGIAADETERIKRHCCPNIVLPLVEIGWDESYCLKWCKENNLLSPIYFKSMRGGCWFCCKQPVNQLRLLRKDYPDLWNLFLKWDKDSPVPFHPDGRTIHDFDRRFFAEDLNLIPKDNKFRWNMLEVALTKYYDDMLGGD